MEHKKSTGTSKQKQTPTPKPKPKPKLKQKETRKRKRRDHDDHQETKKPASEMTFRLGNKATFQVDAERAMILGIEFGFKPKKNQKNNKANAVAVEFPTSLHPVVCRDTLAELGILLSYQFHETPASIPSIRYLAWENYEKKKKNSKKNSNKHQERVIQARQRLGVLAFLGVPDRAELRAIAQYIHLIWEEMYLCVALNLSKSSVQVEAPNIDYFLSRSFIVERKTSLQMFLPNVLATIIHDYVTTRMEQIILEWLDLFFECSTAYRLEALKMWNRALYVDDERQFPILNAMFQGSDDKMHHHFIMPTYRERARCRSTQLLHGRDGMIPFAWMRNNQEDQEEIVKLIRLNGDRTTTVQTLCGGDNWNVRNERLRTFWQTPETTQMSMDRWRAESDDEADDVDQQFALAKIVRTLESQKINK